MSKEEFEIPGMFIAREDIERIIVNRPNMNSDKAIKMSQDMTDNQMDAIAEEFACGFFDGSDLFQKLLKDAVEELEELGIIDLGES